MASRMDRYSKSELTTNATARSDRNKSLYKQIEDLDSYTNIAGIATIENKNSIDLEKVKELLKTKEDIIKKEEKKTVQEKEEEFLEETRNYDIKDLLSKVKSNGNSEEKKYRSLSTKLLKELNAQNKKSKKLNDIKEEDLDEIVKTISNMESISNYDSVDEDDVGLLDELKSDTMVGDAASIKKIIEEEKEFTKEFDNTKIDKSFYTSSFGFTQRDFEELKDINHKIKKDNKFIIILLLVLIFLVIIGVIFFVVM